MADDHGAPEAGHFSEFGAEVIKKDRVTKERAVQRLHSWTVQNEIKGVLTQVSTGAA